MFAPGLLDDASVAVVLPLPHFLQQEELREEQGQNLQNFRRDSFLSVSYRLWSFDEDFGLAQLELVLIHVD